MGVVKNTRDKTQMAATPVTQTITEITTGIGTLTDTTVMNSITINTKIMMTRAGTQVTEGHRGHWTGGMIAISGHKTNIEVKIVEVIKKQFTTDTIKADFPKTCVVELFLLCWLTMAGHIQNHSLGIAAWNIRCNLACVGPYQQVLSKEA